MEAEAYRKEADAAFSELRLEVDTTESMEREDAATDHAGAPFAGTPFAGFAWGRNGP
jgi:hypothetical protein